MVVVLFRSKLAAGASEEHGAMAAELVARAQGMPGFVDFTIFRGTDGEDLLVVHWDSMDALKVWSADTQHIIAKRLGREKWYEYFKVEIAEVTRNYAFDRDSQGPPH